MTATFTANQTMPINAEVSVIEHLPEPELHNKAKERST
jgi:hypothetical protein